jgi:hypothetical protein
MRRKNNGALRSSLAASVVALAILLRAAISW